MAIHATKTLVDFIRDHAQGSAAGIVLIHQSNEEEFLSYKDLYERSLRLLRQLQARGLQPGSELIIQQGNNKEFLVVFWACLLGGIKAVPLSMAVQPELRGKLVRVWQNLAAPWLITPAENFELLADYCDKHSYHAVLHQLQEKKILLEDLTDEPGEVNSYCPEPGSTAYIQYSSGSTGDPKGVVLTHGNLVANTLDIAERSHISRTDKLLSWMPLTHDMGLICFHLTGLVCGVQQFIMPTSLFIRRPVLWMEKAHEHRITVLYSPNFGYQYFLMAYKQGASHHWDLSPIRLIYNGAEQIAAALCNEFLDKLAIQGLRRNSLFPGYGLAEASVAVTLPEPGQPLTSYKALRTSLNIGDPVCLVPSDSQGVELVQLGKPVASCEVRICNDQQATLPEGRVGHIQIRGLNVTGGYYRNEPATRQAMTADGWLKTGDIGFMREGHLVVTGRLKNIIIINGQNYYPGDIESVVSRLPDADTGIGKVAACGITAEKTGVSQLVLFVLHKNGLPAFSAIAARVKQLLYNELGLMVQAVIAVPRIPKTTSGKVQYYKLVEQYRSGAFHDQLAAQNILPEAVQQQAANLPVKERLSLLLRDHTGIAGADAWGDLFEQGMTSLQAVQLVNRINEQFGADIKPELLFECPSLELLALALAGDTPQEKRLPAETGPADLYELSLTQRRFWALENLQTETAPLNIAVAYVITGPLEVSKLEAALQLVVQRQDSLRTVFSSEGGRLQQRIMPFEAATVLEVDTIAGNHPADSWQLPFLQEGIKRRFDLEKGPLFRCRLLHTGPDTQIFLLVVHHLVADGWSLSVLIKEIAVYYNLLVKEEVPQPAGLPVRAPFYLKWRDEQVDAVAYDTSRLYWTNQLQQLPAVNLPYSKARPPFPGFAAKMETRELPASTWKALGQFSAANRATVFMSLAAATFIWLYKMTQDTDLVIGTDFAGRGHREVEALSGCFIQTLLLRLEISQADSFLTILQKMRDLVPEAIGHLSYPYERIVEDHAGKPARGNAGLFNVLMLLHDFDIHPVLSNLQVQQVDTEVSAGLVDLQLVFEKRKEGVAIQLVYNTDMFTTGDARRMLAWVPLLLERLLHTPLTPVSGLDMLPEEEKHSLLHHFNNTSIEYPAGITVVDLIGQCARLRPGRPAIICEDQVLSYAALTEKTNALAHFLATNYRVGPGDRVAILCGRSITAVVAIIATLKTGAAWVPLDKEYPASRLQFMLSDCGAKLVLTDAPDIAPDAGNGAAVIDAATFLRQKPPVIHAGPLAVPTPATVAYIMYTSGSTGQPKGVMIEHKALHDYTRTFIDYFGVTPDDVVIQQSSLSFDTAVEEIFPVLCVGGTLVVHPPGGRDIDGLLALIAKQGATILSTTPGVVQEINKQAGQIKKLRTLISGGDQLKPHHIDKLVQVVDVYNTYGPTESTVCSTYYKVDTLNDTIPIGKPIANRRIYILTKEGELQPIGAIGEICIAGEGLARGYTGHQALTGQQFYSNPFVPHTRLYRTGDLGRWLPDGNIEFAGRKDTQVKLNGYRIELAEIEQVLGKYPAVSEALVLNRHNEQGQPVLIAYCTGHSSLREKDLRLYLSTRLPAYMMPAFFVITDRFPYTANGKVDRNALPLPAFPGRENNTARSGSLRELEAALLRIWQEAFNAPGISIQEGFYEIGGNSIKAFQISAMVKRELGLQLDLRHLLAGLSIEELVSLVSGEEESRLEEIPLAPYADLYPASHAQQRLWILNQIDKKKNSNNLNWSYQLEGPLDIPLFGQVMTTLVQRHESLRTGFVMRQGKLMQQVQPAGSWNMQYLDLRMMNNPLSIARLLVSEEASAAMPLETGPLFKVKLVQTGEQTFVLIVTLHHIITDGWSMETLVREMLVLYEALCTGQSNPLPPLTLQYKDYTYWEATELQRLQDQVRERWAGMFSGTHVAAGIPTDFSRKTVRDYNSDLVALRLDDGLSSALRHFCRQEQVTMTVVLITALNGLLYRYHGGQGPLVTGVMLNGRSRPELENQVGFFINTLPVCIHLDSPCSFATLLQEVKSAQLALLEMQHYPYNLLCEEVAGGRGLFNITVSSLIESTGTIHDLPGIKVSEFAGRSKWRNDFDLTLAIEDTGPYCQLNMLYDTDLYTPKTIESAGRELIAILQAGLSDPGIPVQEIRFTGLPVAQVEPVQHRFSHTPATSNQFSVSDLEQLLGTILSEK